MKKSLLALSLYACALPALAEMSAEVGVISDYRYNGVSQTEQNPAVQAALNYSHDSGFYAGLWGSNAHFSGTKVSTELDTSVGYSLAVAENTVLDAGLATYNYFGGKDTDANNYPELYVGVTLPSNTSIYAHYSHDYGGAGLSSYFVELSQDYEWEEYLFNVRATHTQTDQDDFWGDKNSYQHIEASVARGWQGVDFKLSALATTIEDDDNAEPMLVLGISKAWSW
ncbi:MAG: hypothetical protein RL217_1813 [Pseudomonadota bacterium]